MNAETAARQVVVADDDLLFSSRVTGSLASLGYQAVVVRSAEALHAALRRDPRAAVVNLAARRFDAAEAIRRAKADEATRGVPLLGFCGHRDGERMAAARAAGCDAVTTNGIIAADLGRALGALLATA
ncbi:MAG TPA: hypothetical protein VGZ23_14730 [bacterium]|nr:hypothetical protein [bacterium]